MPFNILDKQRCRIYNYFIIYKGIAIGAVDRKQEEILEKLYSALGCVLTINIPHTRVRRHNVGGMKYV